MAYYKVLAPCVVGKLHYATVPAQPVEVDDVVAGPLVEAGKLAPYVTGVQAVRADIACATEAINAITLTPPEPTEDGSEAEPERPSPRPRGPRRPKD